jgi:hypothetical protein
MDVERPKSITVIDQDSETVLIKKYYSPWSFFLLVVTLLSLFFGFSNLIFTFWYSHKFTASFSLGNIVQIVFYITLIYLTLLSFINRINITIGNGLIKIKDYPLPMWNSKTVEIVNIRHLYIEGDFDSTAYTLMAIFADGNKKAIVKWLSKKDEGLYLKKEIEKFLEVSVQS